MVLPAGSVFKLYCPVRCRATPQADSAPVQDVSLVGLAFCASGSGMLVLMIQSALPAVSALLLSKSTWCGVAAATAEWAGAAVATVVAAVARRRLAREMTMRLRGERNIAGSLW